MCEYHKSQEECFDNLYCAVDTLCEKTEEGFSQLCESIGKLTEQVRILNGFILQMADSVRDAAFYKGS